ncbi:MAG: AzlC family ABC transporter permease [Bifidobacterium tsurumiense]|nr:AzlC family ABC transporter permease [Bifidobacterium tsurumiense]MDY4677814.1 AzlC family ABC transporter permease [Bifidobacterium tsurumiense]
MEHQITEAVPSRMWRRAVHDTLPICAGFLFLGTSYGLLMHVKGFSLLYPISMAALIYAGSMEFVTVDLLLGAFNPLLAFVMALMVNARHLFYGLSMLDRFKGTGWIKPYLIFGMCDETFAVNSRASFENKEDLRQYMVLVTVFNQIYWVSGATLGWLVGGMLPQSATKGIEFVLTALFAVIFMDQWLNSSKPGHISAMVGVAASVICLVIFGSSRFMIPALVTMLLLFVLLRPHLDELAQATPESGKEEES